MLRFAMPIALHSYRLATRPRIRGFTLVELTIVLIIDLDRPQHGTIKVSQQAMRDLVADIGATP